MIIMNYQSMRPQLRADIKGERLPLGSIDKQFEIGGSINIRDFHNHQLQEDMYLAATGRRIIIDPAPFYLK
jgi:hypothetical protein